MPVNLGVMCKAMKRLIFTFALLVCPSGVHALSIDCPVDQAFIYNKEKVLVEYSWDVDTWLIKLKAPKKIEKLEFAYMKINKESEGLAIPLLSESEGSKVSAHFYVGSATAKGMHVRVFYGRHCLQSILVELEPGSSLE